MIFNEIESLKREFTDKFVVIDSSRPELRRFKDLTGVVKTVNMNGRALVEFDGLQNIGWYDIEVDFLKVVDSPLPKQEPAAAAEKPKPAAKATKVEPAAADKPAAGGGMSINDVLAAARGDGGGAAPAKPADSAKPAAEKPPAASGAMSVDDILAAARGKAAPPTKETSAKEMSAKETPAKAPPKPTEAAPADASSMSVADILAAARGKSPASAPASTPPSEPAAETPAAAEPPPEEAAAPAEAESATPSGPLPTDVEGIVAWCRERDAS